MEERADILPIANIGQVCIIIVITLTVELFDVTLHFPRNAKVIHWISFSSKFILRLQRSDFLKYTLLQ